MTAYYGKYRGRVTNNDDPDKRGRLQLSVPSLLGDHSNWAMPSVPYAGPDVGLFAIPPVGAGVWVEFEGGDLNHPIWTGCFWASGQIPSEADNSDVKLFKTDTCTIAISDASGHEGITIETAAGVRLVLNESGLEIDNGQGANVRIQGPTVFINGSALETS